MVTWLLAAALQSNSDAAFRVNRFHTLYWHEEAYMPIGVRIPGTPEAIAAANAAGVRDLIIELPATGDGWSEAFQELEATKQNFLIAISSTIPAGENIQIEPDAYRVEGITNGQLVQVAVPDGRDSLVLRASSEGRIDFQARIPASQGKFTIPIPAGNSTGKVLLLYPIVQDLRSPDYFEGLDQRRDALVKALQSNARPAGFRGIINPMGTSVGGSASRTSIPMSPLFRTEFAAFLRQKYGSASTLLRAWQVGTSAIQTIEEAARLIPLWSNGKGVDQVWDPQTDRLIRCESRSSTIWSDIHEMLTVVGVRRLSRLCDTVRTETGAPVIGEFDGWDGLAAREESGLDGLGLRVQPTDAVGVGEAAANESSAALRRTGPVWMVTTSLVAPTGADLELMTELLRSQGQRAIYFRTDDPSVQRAVAALPAMNLVSADTGPRTLFYPLDAEDPARPMLLPGGIWWLPAPIRGDVLRLGSLYGGYTLPGENGIRTVLWSKRDPVQVRLVTDEPEAIQVTTADGTVIPVRKVRRGVEFVLPSLPVIVAGPIDPVVPGPSFEEASGLANSLLTRFGRIVDGDGQVKVTFGNTLRTFDASPAQATNTMWAIVDNLVQKSAPYVWLAAPQASELRMGGIVDRQGSTSRRVIRFASRLGSEAPAGAAKFAFEARAEGQHEIWVAASISPSARGQLSVHWGEVSLPNQDAPVSPYGQGFAWYKLGTVNLIAGRHQVEVLFSPLPGTEMLLDAIVIAPGEFHPDGPRFPIDWIKSLPPLRGNGTGSPGN